MNAERFARLRLIRSGGIGPRKFYPLIKKYGSAVDAVSALGSQAATIQEVEQEIRASVSYGARLIHITDSGYPSLLKEIADPPPVITAFGTKVDQLGSASIKRVAIVGSRNSSANGLSLAAKVARQCSERGYGVVSGLARGIDSAAHKNALDGGIAVLAGGIDHIYPPENRLLYSAIASAGVILSEAPFGSIPRAEHFPKRNRLVSGLSHAVLVIEAAIASGSLITARCAIDQNREVFAVPGFPLDPRCQGTNRLIKQGACLFESIEDIATFFGEQKLVMNEPERRESQLQRSQIGSKADLLAQLNYSPIKVDELIRVLHMEPSAIAALLTELEIDNTITIEGNEVRKK